MPAPTFVAVGDVMVDVTAAGKGHSARIDISAGGSAVNAAIAAVGNGASATVIGRVGDDLGGRALRTALEEHGVRAELSLDHEVPTGTFLIVDGEVRADRGANATFTPEHLPGRLAGAAVLVSGYLPAQTVAAALRRADAEWLALAPALLDPIPPGANAVLVDEDEARRITGSPPEEAARSLGETFRLACVSRGAAGAVAVLDGRFESRTAEPVDAKGTVGAGDAFAAALLVALVRGEDLGAALADACTHGAAIAASST